jgi:hypothetical protein
MKKNATIDFALKNIVTEQFAIIDESFTDSKEINIRTDIGFGLDKDNRMVRVHLKISFLCLEQPFLLLEVAVYFIIKPESYELFLNEDKTLLTLPAGIAQHLGVIAVGTARGILHAKTENTEYNKFFLPTLNLVELVKEDVVFNL